MTETTISTSAVIRNSRGLSIAGTRITLYNIMDYLKEDWPPKLIGHWLRLTEKQIADAMDYIKTHRAEVEAEYQQVLQYAEENQRYWEERNREHFEKIKARPPKPGTEHLWAKLQAQKAKRGMM